jgi:hypothetical protein
MKSLSGEEVQKEEWAMIQAGFNDLEKRVKLLPELKKMGFEEEALLLCCCYIEAMGNLYFPDSRGGGKAYNFYRALKSFGEEERFMHIHLKQLWIGLRSDKTLQKIGQKIGVTLKKAEKKLYSEKEVLALVGKLLDEKEMTKLSDNLWRGTLAALAYGSFRNPGVHELGGAKSFSFEGTTFKGKQVPVLGFSLLYKGMLNILRNMREISAKGRTYFGQTFDFLLDAYLANDREWEKLGSENESRLPLTH